MKRGIKMNELTTWNFGESKVRTLERDGEPWFVGKDVAEVLGYSNPRKAIIDHVDDEDKGVTKCDTLGGMQNLTVVNESGLYSLILSSKLPTAKEFKHWVTSEVLPTIRRHGAYMTEQTIEQAISDPDFIIRLATELKTEKTKRLALEAQAEADKPKVIFADAVSVAKTSILIGELAKILKQNGVNIGQNRLFEYLRNKGYLISRNGSDRNMPTQRAMEMGLFEVKETIVSHSDGHTSISKTPKVTGKGQQYFINHFLKGA
jgi:anti-repressor protein